MKLYKRKITASRKFTQAMTIVPYEFADDFADFLDSIRIDYTYEDAPDEAPDGVKFIYGIYIGSRESKQIDRYLNKII